MKLTPAQQGLLDQMKANGWHLRVSYRSINPRISLGNAPTVAWIERPATAWALITKGAVIKTYDDGIHQRYEALA